jgi:hypothetical protein
MARSSRVATKGIVAEISTHPSSPRGGWRRFARARNAASELRHVELDEAAALLVLIAKEDPASLDAAALGFLGHACLKRSFITLDDAQLLIARLV